jgi:hypothetical protein
MSKEDVAALMTYIVEDKDGQKTADGNEINASSLEFRALKWLLADREITEERLVSIIDHYDAWVEEEYDQKVLPCCRMLPYAAVCCRMLPHAAVC